MTANGSKLGIGATRNYRARLKRAWLPLSKMDVVVKAKVEKLFSK